jgi:hypothetical protein
MSGPRCPVSSLQQPYGYGGSSVYRDQDQPYQRLQQHYQQHHQQQQGNLDYEGYGEESMHDNSRPPSEPSRDVIFLGLDLNVDEEVVSRSLIREALFSSHLADIPVSAFYIPLAHTPSC